MVRGEAKVERWRRKDQQDLIHYVPQTPCVSQLLHFDLNSSWSHKRKALYQTDDQTGRNISCYCLRITGLHHSWKIQICNKSRTDETRHCTRPPQISEQHSWWLLPPNHLIPTEKLLLFLISRWDLVWICIHWMAQDSKQRPILLHVGGVYTNYVLNLFPFLCMKPLLLCSSWKSQSSSDCKSWQEQKTNKVRPFVPSRACIGTPYTSSVISAVMFGVW